MPIDFEIEEMASVPFVADYEVEVATLLELNSV